MKMSAERFGTGGVKWREWRPSCYSHCSTYLRRPGENELDYHPSPDAVKHGPITSLKLGLADNSHF